MRKAKIINVTRKPSKCPKCGEDVWDVVYGTGDYTESEILFEYRKSVVCGGDIIPKRPPIWSCSCCDAYFRKVNPDGTDAPVKVKMLKNLRRAPLTKIVWESKGVIESLGKPNRPAYKYYDVDFMTDINEKGTFSVCAIDEDDAKDTVQHVYVNGGLGFKGQMCIITGIREKY